MDETGAADRRHRAHPAGPPDTTGSRVTELLSALNWESRRSAALLGMLNRAVAGRFKLNPVDVDALGVLSVLGAATPTRLASLLGMGTGSMTLVIDRLEQAGFVRRVRESKDRRSVTIEVIENRARELSALYAPVQRRGAEIAGRYSESELRIILDYLGRSNDMLNDLATGLTEFPGTEPAGAPEEAANT